MTDRAQVRRDGAATWGTHNMADRAVATPFADVIGWTEAKAGDCIEGDLPRHYETVVCRRQKSLALSFDARRFKLLGKRYHRAHDGEAKISPGRGTWVIRLRDRHTRDTFTVLLTHRVNNAHGPVKRPGRDVRERFWRMSYALDAALLRHVRTDHTVALGDLNKSAGRVWPRLNQTGRGYDRIGWSTSLRRIGEVDVLSPMGSDHHRKRITLAPKHTTWETP